MKTLTEDDRKEKERLISINGTRSAYSSVRKHGYEKWFLLIAIFWPFISIISWVFPLKFFINKKLNQRGSGEIDGIRLSLIHPSCTIKGFHFEKVNAGDRDLLDCAAKEIKLSFEWNALRKGILVGDVISDELKLFFTKVKENQNDRKTLSQRFHIPVPLVIKELSITNGKISFTDTTRTPVVRLEIDDILVEILQLTTLATEEVLPTPATIRANLYDGVLTIHLKANLSEKPPAFDIDAEIIGMDMRKMNDFFKAYGKFDVNCGTLGLFTEMAAKNGKYKGYVKPIIRDLDIVGTEDKHENLLQRMWESAAGAAAAIIKNQKKDQLATKIPIEGSFKPDVDVWYAIIETLINAFIHALKPSIDYEINIASLNNS